MFVETRELTQIFELCPLFNLRVVACSDYVNHNRVQVLRIPVVLFACSQDWTWNLQVIVSLGT